jgi:hypothetical protein
MLCCRGSAPGTDALSADEFPRLFAANPQEAAGRQAAQAEEAFGHKDVTLEDEADAAIAALIGLSL